jgi:hypothetical protein
MTGNYTIAMCDILGFPKLIDQQPLQSVVSSMEWFRKALLHALRKDDFLSNAPSLKQLQALPKLGVALFSDTILIYTREDNDECLQALISSVAWLLFETMFTTDLRLRCRIAYGEAYIDPTNSIYFGKGIIEAYHLEECQAWSGGALTATAVGRIPRDVRSGKVPSWALIPYKVPLNDGRVCDTLAINWTFGRHRPLDFRWSQKNAQPTRADWVNQRRVCEK